MDFKTDYTVVFDAAQQSFPWWIILVPIAFLALLSSAFITKDKASGALPRRKDIVILLPLIGLFGSCMACFGLLNLVESYNEAHYYVSTQSALVVEGPIQDLTDKGKVESFTVSGVHFLYGGADARPGFHSPSMNGGPITNDGLYVRIHYAFINADPEPTILKLEIRK